MSEKYIWPLISTAFTLTVKLTNHVSVGSLKKHVFRNLYLGQPVKCVKYGDTVLFKMQAQVWQVIHNLCQHALPCRLPRPPSVLSNITKDLKLSPEYNSASQNFAGQREFIQNWYDQCTLIARNHRAQVKIHEERGEMRNLGGKYRVFFAHAEEKVGLGFVAEIVVGEVAVETYFVNFGILDEMTFRRFYYSTKTIYFKVHAWFQKCSFSDAVPNRDDLSMGGYFGEGVKVAINCLSAENVVVTYHPGGNVWTF